MRTWTWEVIFDCYQLQYIKSKRFVFQKHNQGYSFYPLLMSVRSFLYLLYTLVKLYCTKALSDPASSLALDWILLLRRPRTPASLRDSETTFHLGGLSRILQDKVRMLGALVLCSPSEHVFRCTLLTLQCGCVNEWNALREASEESCSAVPRRPHTAYGRNLSGVYTDLPSQGAPNVSFGNQLEMGKACGQNSPFSVKLFSLFDHFITPWKLQVQPNLSNHRLSRDL